MTVIRFLIAYFARFVFWLRYRIRVEGLEELRGLERALIIPNHPAYIDPAVVLSAVWPVLRPRPMLLAEMFESPLLAWLPWILRAVEIPNLEQQSSAAREQAQRTIQAVVEGLKRGENFILWPAGRVQRRNAESLGAARSLAEILSAVPEANVVAVRTRGLWGSRFSFARTGTKPPLVKTLLQGLGLLFANLLFFSPRREVSLTIRRFEPKDLPERTRERLNPFFERWYNEPGPDTPTFVPGHFAFGPRTYEFPALETKREVRAAEIKPELRADVAQMIAEKLGRPLEEKENRAEVSLETLGLDSLDRMELAMSLEGRFGFRGEEVPASMGDLWALAAGLVEQAPPKPAPAEWFSPPSDEGRLAVLGETIAEAFTRRALRCSRDVVVADDLSGVLTYERLLVGARAMARQIGAVAAPNVGVMMPASVAGDLVVLAAHLAGKLPVLMNWTTGPANLAHAARTMGLTHVVTSKAFVDRTGVAIEGVEYLFLEYLRKRVGRVGLLAELLRVRWQAWREKSSQAHVSHNTAETAVPHGALSSDGAATAAGEADAVVLFTSGSEKAPKAVPLTHRNIMSNLRSVFEAFALSRNDSLIGFLPIFHSFGVTITSLLPVLGGARVVHHPDPTDAAGLVKKLASYRVTILAGTPTFVGYILDRAKPEDLTSLRLIVVGAEKCPAALFERVAKLAPQAMLIEGYGITECSPLVAANRIESPRPGTIGHAIPGVEVRVVDPDTHAPLPGGEMGMLLVSGPNVFRGYIASPGGEAPPDPFVQMDGRRWYVTGDLARIDAEGYIHFAGRLKRFIKAGGEMISLPAIEEPLAQKYPPDEDGPRVAVEGVELAGGGRRVVLFTREGLSVAEANALLTGAGLRGIMRIDEVRKVERIPLLGTGKTDYKVLRAQIEK